MFCWGITSPSRLTPCHCPGCGTQQPQRFACVLLAAAPTATPCFRHWRRSSLLLLPRGGFGISESFSSSPEAPLPGELSAKQTERLDEGKPVREALTERFNSILLYLRNQFRVNLFQIEFEQFGDAVLLHGDAVEDIGGLDRKSVV